MGCTYFMIGLSKASTVPIYIENLCSLKKFLECKEDEWAPVICFNDFWYAKYGYQFVKNLKSCIG